MNSPCATLRALDGLRSPQPTRGRSRRYPEWALGELAASEAPFDSCYSGGMRAKLLGFDLAGLSRAASGELLFAWRDGGPREREEEPKNP